MSKNKDPAFLLYSSDFLTGVSDLTMTERGKYITLLCLQHQKGHLSKKTINLAVGKMTKSLLDKFQKDSEGNYYNKRLESVLNRRATRSIINTQNGKKGGRPQKANEKQSTKQNESKTKANAIENENNYVVHSNNIELCTDIFPFSDTTTTTECNSACAPENPEQKEKFDNINFEIIKYFVKQNFESNVEDFFAYNEARGWKGIGGEDVREDFARYADRWEAEERRKRGGPGWKPDII